jgi:hypothetical protein
MIREETNLEGSFLTGVTGNSITLSDFTTDGDFNSVFCIGEIAIMGQPIPEPSIGIFILCGVATAAVFCRR